MENSCRSSAIWLCIGTAAVIREGDGEARVGLQGMAHGSFAEIVVLEAVWGRQEVNSVLFPKNLISFVAKVALGHGS